jgi:hypothetical protein
MSKGPYQYRAYTIADLDFAGEWAFDFSGSYKAILAESNRVRAHEIACIEAFLTGAVGVNVDILRSALWDLKHKSMYCPSDGKFPDEFVGKVLTLSL